MIPDLYRIYRKNLEQKTYNQNDNDNDANNIEDAMHENSSLWMMIVICILKLMALLTSACV